MYARGFSLGIAFIAAPLILAGPAASAASAPSGGKAAPAISERLARDIAWRFGLVHVEEIALWGMYWEIAGRDRDGNERALDIDAHDGRVLN